MYPHLTKKELLEKLKEFKVSETKLIKKALIQAIKSHKKQLRDDGSSYLEEHIYPVTVNVIEFYLFKEKKTPETLVAMALLHDTLEDDPRIKESAFKKKFGKKIFSMVKFLSKPRLIDFDGKNLEEIKLKRDKAYFKQLKKAPLEAKIVKAADRLNNIQCLVKNTRLKKVKRILFETKNFYLPFVKSFSNYFYKKLVKEFKYANNFFKAKI